MSSSVPPLWGGIITVPSVPFCSALFFRSSVPPRFCAGSRVAVALHHGVVLFRASRPGTEGTEKQSAGQGKCVIPAGTPALSAPNGDVVDIQQEWGYGRDLPSGASCIRQNCSKTIIDHLFPQ